MATISFVADQKDESLGGQKVDYHAPRGFYTLQIADYSDGQKTTAGKFPGTPITKFVCEIADEGEHFGKKVWHSVTWIPRGTGTKPNGGHGMAVHFLHAVGMTFNGQFNFEESDFQGRRFPALLEVEEYESKKVDGQGRPYLNKKNVVQALYTEANPQPAELPPPPVAKARPQSAAPAAQGNDGIEEVPF